MKLDFEKMGGLVTAIIQDAETGKEKKENPLPLVILGIGRIFAYPKARSIS